jgi:hypothetical protein
MSVVLTLTWPGATKEQYDKLNEIVDWENQVAPGGIFHFAWWEGDTMQIVDVWEREQDWQSFFDARIAPNLEAVGVETQPSAQGFHEVHAYFNAESAHAAA